MKWLIIAFSFLFAISVNVSSEEMYVVKKGDTLWDISNSFLGKPYHWPEIWHINQEIENPHLIYPGDKLRFIYNEKTGEYSLEVIRVKELKWNPNEKEQLLDSGKYLGAVDLKEIKNEIGKFFVFENKDEINDLKLSKIMGSKNNSSLISKGDEVFVDKNSMFKKGQTLLINTNPVKIERAGVSIWESEQIGRLRLIEENTDNWLAIIEYSAKEIKEGYWLSDKEVEFSDKFIPTKNQINKSNIVKIYENRTVAGKYRSFLIDSGRIQGSFEGSVLEIKTSDDSGYEFTKGHGIVYKVYNNFSYVLIFNNNIKIKIENFVE